MGCVPAGVFLRGENGRHRAARPQESVELDVYWMDRNEVTTAAYRECVRQKKCKKAGPNYSDFSAPQQPVTGVNWFHADAFCRAQGKHLPTEAEWEKAARGEKGAPFSWGNAPATCKRAVLKNSRGRSCGKKKKGRSGKPEVGRPEKVGSKAAGVYGLFDMAGNSWEWVADWSSSSYKTCGEACRGKNPKGPCAGRSPCKGHREKVVRGGSWYWPASYATAFRRRKHVPRNWPFHHFGFRCAANLAEARTLAKANLEE
ncbi:MAG: formylglycine-generating enzyme family protein [Deltaproteobacteria bacterium]|nr:formylglycine-generating enzyme family protein [Deltaproteobacteria bacterium]